MRRPRTADTQAHILHMVMMTATRYRLLPDQYDLRSLLFEGEIPHEGRISSVANWLSPDRDDSWRFGGVADTRGREERRYFTQIRSEWEDPILHEGSEAAELLLEIAYRLKKLDSPLSQAMAANLLTANELVEYLMKCRNHPSYGGYVSADLYGFPATLSPDLRILDGVLSLKLQRPAELAQFSIYEIRTLLLKACRNAQPTVTTAPRGEDYYRAGEARLLETINTLNREMEDKPHVQALLKEEKVTWKYLFLLYRGDVRNIGFLEEVQRRVAAKPILQFLLAENLLSLSDLLNWYSRGLLDRFCRRIEADAQFRGMMTGLLTISEPAVFNAPLFNLPVTRAQYALFLIAEIDDERTLSTALKYFCFLSQLYNSVTTFSDTFSTTYPDKRLPGATQRLCNLFTGFWTDQGRRNGMGEVLIAQRDGKEIADMSAVLNSMIRDVDQVLRAAERRRHFIKRWRRKPETRTFYRKLRTRLTRLNEEMTDSPLRVVRHSASMTAVSASVAVPAGGLGASAALGAEVAVAVFPRRSTGAAALTPTSRPSPAGAFIPPGAGVGEGVTATASSVSSVRRKVAEVVPGSPGDAGQPPHPWRVSATAELRPPRRGGVPAA